MRMTPQTQAVIQELQKRGHASNLELLKALHNTFSDLSATTVHRITKRLVAEKQIGILRSPLDGTALLDANAAPHYHFACQPCGKVQDIQLSKSVVSELQEAVGHQIMQDTLVVTGIKTNCPHYKS
jgi:Fur family transcriptional regulator, peroxide stress response regulator